jgi:hypothetical protein
MTDKKKYYQVTAMCDYQQCVRILASSKEEAEELFLQGEWYDDDVLTEEYDDYQEVIRVDEEVT